MLFFRGLRSSSRYERTSVPEAWGWNSFHNFVWYDLRLRLILRWS